MDIRTNEDSRGVEVYPLRSKIIIGISIVAAVAIFFTVQRDVSLLAFSLVLVTVGLTTTESWNRELKEDGYASLTQLYSSYIAALFLLIAVLPAMSVFLSIQFAIPVSLLVVFLYAVAVKSIAYRGIEEYETAVESYDSPAVVYLSDGPFIKHIKELAHQNKEKDEAEESDEDEVSQDNTEVENGGLPEESMEEETEE